MQDLLGRLSTEEEDLLRRADQFTRLGMDSLAEEELAKAHVVAAKIAEASKVSR